MKNICFYFQVHQPFRFRKYRFFDIGDDHYYYDDYTNELVLHKVMTKCYLPTNKLLLELINKYKGEFKVAFSISGIALDQFQLYAPEVIDSFRELVATGHVELLSETYSHSLAALKDRQEFERQVNQHREALKDLFDYTPTVFRNTELIYSDQMGEMVADMGFKAMLTEGAKHVLGWKSPNFMYCNAINPRLKVLLKNYVLSDDIAFRFGNKEWNEWPLSTKKYVSWIKELDAKEEVVNLFLDYETFGEHQWKETGIFEFLEDLPKQVLADSKLRFATPSELADKLQPISAIQVPTPISWADEERDITAWLGNEMQHEAFDKLYSLLPKINQCSDERLLKDWRYLQASDHFYYMCTKFFSDGEVHAYFNPYDTPYEAFINYMNILSDFALRLNSAVPETSSDQELANLSRIVEEKEERIRLLEEKLKAKNKTTKKGGGSKTRKSQSKVSV